MRSVWVVLALVACGSKSKEPPKSAPPPASDTATPAGPETPKLTKCAEFATAMCAAFERCMPHATFVKWNSRENCEAQAVYVCELWAAPNSKTTDESISLCISDLAVIKCAHFRGWETTACRPAPGALADGAPCTTGAQCSGRSCQMDYQAGCNKCAREDSSAVRDRPPGRGVGETCASIDDCAEGLACVKRRCTVPKLAELDQPCTGGMFGAGGTDPCRFGLECVIEGKRSVCKKVPAQGEACERGVPPSCPYQLDCIDGACQPPLVRPCKS